MERKNTVLLTVIAVATLLVAVVGATFAYFTASSGITGNGGKGTTNVNTADLANNKITINQENTDKSNNTVYPGTMNYASSGLTATVEGNATYKVTYKINVNIATKDAGGSSASQFDFPIKWRLYESDEKVTPVVTCQSVTSTPSGNDFHYTQSCEENETSLTDGKLIASGTLQKADECSASETTDKNRVSCGSEATYSTNKTFESVSSAQKADKYYYLVVEYPTVPSDDQDQSSDMNKQIQATVDVAVSSTEIVQ